MIFAQDDDGFTLCLYAASRTKVTLGGVETDVIEETGYPFDGRVEVTLNPAATARFAVRLRVPTWTGKQFVPGELYRYVDTSDERVQLFVNDEAVELTVKNGMARVEREWSAGDTIRLELPMPVRMSACREEVAANRGRVALTRGPLVYCAESADNPGHVYNYLAPTEEELAAARIEQLKIGEHTTAAVVVDSRKLDGNGQLVSTALTLVPYYAWNNRGVGSMVVWLPNNEETLRRDALVIDDNAQRFKSARATHTFDQDRVGAMIDGRLPKDSFDTSIPRWTSWPERGKLQTLEFELAQPTELRTVDVYWYDDRGGVQVPDRWELEVWRDGKWQTFPLYNTDAYYQERDQFNVVHPAEPLVVERIRMQVWPREDAGAGVLEFVVQPE